MIMLSFDDNNDSNAEDDKADDDDGTITNKDTVSEGKQQ